MKGVLSKKFFLSGVGLLLLIIIGFGVISLFSQSRKIGRKEGVVLGDLIAHKGENGNGDEDRNGDKDEAGGEAESEEKLEDNEEKANAHQGEDQREADESEVEEEEERIEIKKEEDRTEIRIKKEGEEEKRIEIRTRTEEKEEEREDEEEVEFTGIVESIFATAWVVGGKTVSIGTFVKIEGDPKVGDLVKVEAEVQKDGSLMAKEIELEKEEEREEETEFKGVVESIGETSWVIDGKTVVISADTEIEGAPKVGDLVKVEGLLKEDGAILAKEIESKEEESELKIEQEEGKTKVKIKTGGVERSFELEEKEGKTLLRLRLKDEISGEESDLEIKARQERFELKHRGTTATTAFPISIDPETNEMSVTTPAGTAVVKTLPSVAIKNMLTLGLADKVSQTEIVENLKPESGESSVAIEVSGSKQKKFLGIFKVNTPVKIRVDATSGETLDIEQPLVFRWLRFLFR